MSDPIDDAWSNPAESDPKQEQPSRKPPSGKELLRQWELQERQINQAALDLQEAKKNAKVQQAEMEGLRAELKKQKELADTYARTTFSQHEAMKVQEELIRSLETKNSGGGDDRVVYKGKVHRIVRVNTAKWFALDDFRKRYVEEDDTVVVIDRKGI